MNKNFVEAVLRSNGLGRALEEQEAVFLWGEVAGNLGRFAEADYVQSGILHLTASSPSAAQEITLQASELVRRLNQRLRHGAIRKLKVRASGLPRRRRKVAPREASIPQAELEELICGIGDAELRERFVRLYQSQRNRETSLLAAGAKRCPLCGVVHTDRDIVCAGCRYDTIEETTRAD